MNSPTMKTDMTKDGLKLLVIGGYGTFGGRLVRLLQSDPRLTIIVAGRSLHNAESFVVNCGGPARLIAACIDRDGDLRQRFVELAPDYVIDASGPWQNYGDNAWRVAEAALAAGAHYLDLADSTGFVSGIPSLHETAVRHDVAAISGLSTCPALTAAVVRELAADFSVVETVTGGISPSPCAGMGRSVIDAIAAYAGQPVSILEDGAVVQKHTFVSSRKLVIAPPGHVPFPPLTFALVDVPDLKLLPLAAGTTSGAWFGVATRPAIYLRALRLLARGVKAGAIPSLKSLAAPMHLFVNHLSWGEHRGGMMIELRGRNRDGVAVSKSWHLEAAGDLGPNVPVLACTAVIRAHLDGRPPAPGARSGDRELALADFAPLFAELGIVTGVRTDPVADSRPLFRKILGAAWTDIPPAIRTLHGEQGHSYFAGAASVRRGRSLLSKLIGRAIGIPPQSGSIPVTVSIEPSNGKERWTRDFSGHAFTSEYSQGAGRYERLICERFGPVKVGMALAWDGERLTFIPRCWSFLGIPMPRFLVPSGDIHESVDNGKFRFHVEIRLPLAGHVVTYEGALVPVD